MSHKQNPKFEPIAIVGRGCVLPGCHSVDDLWQIVDQGGVATSSGSEDDWHVDQQRLLSDKPGVYELDKMWSNHGGYVRDFDSYFDPAQFQLEPEFLKKLDPIFLWSMEAARQALAEISSSVDENRAGVVMGNLSYPTRSHSRFAEEVWLNQMRGLATSEFQPEVAAENRFMSGLPAMLVAQGLGLGGSTMALDAACASGLYAIKVACDRLQSGQADLMLAGGVNAADPLFIHMGFCALNALSSTGKSQPFSQSADGLVPSDGAAFVMLKRLTDARADGDKIHGVIRGIGLSNDGRSGGFLSPSADGQVRCIQQAFEVADIDPAEVQFVECHATGTEAGDSTEIESLSRVFKDADSLPLGSLKGNLGHLITVSGVAGLLKVILGFEHEKIPGTPNSSPNLPSIGESGFRIPTKSSAWVSERPRLAGVSSFGFGGNNAHLLVQEDHEALPMAQRATSSDADPAPEMAIVRLAVRTDQDASAEDLGYRVNGRLTSDQSGDHHQISLSAKSLAFPPNDLKEALGQQLVLLELLPEVQTAIESVASDRVGIFIGMQTDSEVCRYGLRWRLQDLAPDASIDLDAEIASSPNAASVIGKMPNVPANRLSNQLNITGPGFTVSREELSGDAALELAMTAIRRGELDAVIVGAVELGREQVHEAAIAGAGGTADVNQPAEAADAAVLMVVKSVAQAKLDGDQILALIAADEDQPAIIAAQDKNAEQSAPSNGAHAAEGLLNIAMNVQRLRAGQSQGTNIASGIKPEAIRVHTQSMFGESSSWMLTPSSSGAEPYASIDRPAIEVYAADDVPTLLTRIAAGETCDMDTVDAAHGPCRAALVGNPSDFDKLRQRAIKNIQSSDRADISRQNWSLDGVCFSMQPTGGEIASVFTGAASAYPGMGKDLFTGLPGLSLKQATAMPESAKAMLTAFDATDEHSTLPAFQLAGSSYLCQLHALIVRELLGIESDAAMGLSSGETNSMFAFGVWQDMDSLLQDIGDSQLYESALAGDFSAVREAWGLKPGAKVDWENYRVLAPVESVQRVVEKHPRVYLTIIQSDDDCVIGGDRAECETALLELESPKTIPLGHDLAVHCAAVEPFEAAWRDIHTRETQTDQRVRFYSSYLDGVYTPDTAHVADALTGQALQTIDFRKIVNNAWEDGVRVFIEHGPRNSLTSAIDEILGDRPHVAVSLDHSAIPSMTQLYRAVASLWCAGVKVNLKGLELHQPQQKEEPAGPVIQFPMRLPPIKAQATLMTEQSVNIDKAVYRAPSVSAGPDTGRLMIPAPALAYTIDPPASTRQPEVASAQDKQPATAIAPVSRSKPEIVPLQVATKTGAASNVAPLATVSASQPVEMNPSMRHISATPTQTAAPSLVGLNEHQILIDTHKKMVEAHQSFLAAQMQGQQAFEESMSRMQTLLLGDVANAGAPIVQMPSQALSTEATAEGNASQTTLAKPHAEAPQAISEAIPSTIEQTNHQTSKQVAQLSSVPQEVQIERPGPAFSREELQVLAGGKISSVFGELFEQQDRYDIQVRMPEPPLLLCDRVMGIEGDAGSMGTGTIWTETDVTEESWYLHRGRMPPGIFIESGQADLLLISWLGIDFHNKGERAYRLLGCELTFHGELPQPGDTLRYEIKVDGHAQQGDVRLFFFHYDCHINGELRISVRSGQAGFFTKDELAESAGVLWDADSADYTPGVEVPEPIATSRESSFSRKDVAAYLEGDLQACFGEEFALAHTHTTTPRSPSGQGNFLGEVTHFDPNGGPAGRGYLRVVEDISENDWFFDGHFKNDPCMPGTLMADACLQAMAFYMSARGHSLHHDGWRFQPVRDTNYKFICRGQALPTSQQLVYEIFVDEEIIDSEPRLFAHVLCTIDGRKAFLCERLGLQLVPDWPISSMPELLVRPVDERPLAYIDDFPLDYRSLINCAWGKPSTAFGPGFAHYDGPLRSPRLPGPPYHFMTRIVALDGEMASMKKGGRVEAIYDIEPDAWYFAENASMTMPYCVLMEIALQPCGWLASYTLGRDYADSDLLFRNLDGTAVQHREIVPGDGTLKTSVELISISQIGELIIENFEVVCTINDEPVFTMKTVFGFFPPDAMANQKGLTITDQERVIFDRAGNVDIDLGDRPESLFAHPTAHLPASKLLMLDRITYLEPDGGQAGNGSIRGEKDVDLTEWFFKAHFFQDPVQPGSLGIEAMLQLMQALMLEQGMHEGFSNPRFEPILIEAETEWHYRGQITPDKKLITIDFDCVERHVEPGNCWISGEARLWGDGLKIYHAPRIGLRIVEDTLGLGNAASDMSASNIAPSNMSTSKNANSPVALKGIGANAENAFNWREVRDYWIAQADDDHYLIHDLGAALMRKFVRRVVVADHQAFNDRKGQPAIYLANHQVGLESFLFLGIIAAMTGIPAEAIAKKEHRDTWLGQIAALTETELKSRSTTRMLFFDRDDQSDMLRILTNFGETITEQPRSLLVHVDGTRATKADQQIEKVSSVLIDLAVKHRIPIIPVRFCGGLPLEASAERLEFPVGYGGQDYFLGSPITPEEVESLPYVDRSRRVAEAINSLGTDSGHEDVLPGDTAFAELVAKQMSGRPEIPSVLLTAIRALPDMGADMLKIIEAIDAGLISEAELTKAEKILATLLG